MNAIRSNRHRKTYLLVSIAVVGVISLCAILLLAMLLYIGRAPKSLPSALGSAPIQLGPLSLEERILEADVIAKVRIHSVIPGAEPLDPNDDDVQSDDLYIGALVYTFEVLEYLKGSGGSQIEGIVHAGYAPGEYVSQREAAIRGDTLLNRRNTGWDDRESIVFLRNNDWILISTQQSDRYFFGTQTNHGDGYTIASGNSKRWLPAASAGGASGASGSDQQRFLTDEPSGGSSRGVSGASAETPSMTLAELKARIAEIETEVKAGDGSEEYRQCLIAGYEWKRRVGHKEKRTIEYSFESGLRAGRWVYEDWRTYHTREFSLADPEAPHPEYWLEGRDKDLFYIEHPGVVFATRPLPKGKYKMFYQVRGHRYIICDAYPESERDRHEYVVDVIPPDGALHEAFFDPVAIGTAVGADAANGVLKPASFTAEGIGGISIERIEWADRQVKMRLSPHNRLAGHHIDFIALDGTIALRLDFDDATEVGESGAQSLAWGVCIQPWQDGDLLMLRISKSEAELTDATNDAACAPTPTATPTPQPTPASTATAQP